MELDRCREPYPSPARLLESSLRGQMRPPDPAYEPFLSSVTHCVRGEPYEQGREPLSSKLFYSQDLQKRGIFIFQRPDAVAVISVTPGIEDERQKGSCAGEGEAERLAVAMPCRSSDRRA